MKLLVDLKSQSNNELLRKGLSISLFFHLLAVIFSVGFLHYDEHFQILEFLNLKLGGTTADQLTWEYHHQMRSWFQPGLFYGVSQFFKALGITNPHFLVFIFRFISSLFGMMGLYFLLSYFLRWSDLNLKESNTSFWKILLVGIGSLTWYFPLIHARPSSDNWGPTLFILGLGYFLNSSFKRKLTPYLIGIIFGLSFLSRFQMGIAIASFFGWGLFFSKKTILIQLKIFLGVILSVLVGVLIDYWGYGQWTFTPWNYLDLNIFQGKVSNFGVSPWWDYFRLSILRGIPPISLLLTFGVFLFWGFFPKSIFTWITLPFFLVHSLIGHKEMRFIFFLHLLAPFFFWQCLTRVSELRGKIWNFLQQNWVKNSFIYLIILPNLILLILTSIRPAKVTAKLFQFIHYTKGIQFPLYYLGGDPYQEVGRSMNFYKKLDLKTNRLEQLEGLKDLDRPYGIITQKGNELLFVKNNLKGCDMKFRTYPDWVTKYNIGNWVSRSTILTYFECR